MTASDDNNPLRLQAGLAHTPSFTRGFTEILGVSEKNGVIAIDGPSGTGKSTCTYAVAKCIKRPMAVFTLTDDPTPLELLKRIVEALTGERPLGSRFDLQNEALPLLRGWRGILAFDEFQASKQPIMRELTWAYEESRRGFTLVLVGTGVLNALGRHPQLEGRLLGEVVFAPLAGDEMLDAVRVLDPRLGKATNDTLSRHNHKACNGLLRRWTQTIEWLDILEMTGVATETKLREVRNHLPAANS